MKTLRFPFLRERIVGIQASFLEGAKLAAKTSGV